MIVPRFAVPTTSKLPAANVFVPVVNVKSASSTNRPSVPANVTRVDVSELTLTLPAPTVLVVLMLPAVKFAVTSKLPVTFAPVDVTTNTFATPPTLIVTFPLTAGMFTSLVPLAVFLAVSANKPVN